MRSIADGFGTTRNSKGFRRHQHERQGAPGRRHEREHPHAAVPDRQSARDRARQRDDGIGGGMATGDLDRDTNKWAMKCSEMVIDGERIDIFKDPITDPGKKSKKGPLRPDPR
jgi:nicotinamide phosphoribosyltransferase